MSIISFIKKWFTLPPQKKEDWSGEFYLPPTPKAKLKVGAYMPPMVTGRWAEHISMIRVLASNAGYEEIAYQPDNKMISFAKGGGKARVRVNVYYSTMTIGTCLYHPTQGNTQLFRRNVNLETLQKILEKPRVHSGKGYQKKG